MKEFGCMLNQRSSGAYEARCDKQKELGQLAPTPLVFLETVDSFYSRETRPKKKKGCPY